MADSFSNHISQGPHIVGCHCERCLRAAFEQDIRLLDGAFFEAKVMAKHYLTISLIKVLHDTRQKQRVCCDNEQKQSLEKHELAVLLMLFNRDACNSEGSQDSKASSVTIDELEDPR